MGCDDENTSERSSLWKFLCNNASRNPTQRCKDRADSPEISDGEMDALIAQVTRDLGERASADILPNVKGEKGMSKGSVPVRTPSKTASITGVKASSSRLVSKVPVHSRLRKPVKGQMRLDMMWKSPISSQTGKTPAPFSVVATEDTSRSLPEVMVDIPSGKKVLVVEIPVLTQKERDLRARAFGDLTKEARETSSNTQSSTSDSASSYKGVSEHSVASSDIMTEMESEEELDESSFEGSSPPSKRQKRSTNTVRSRKALPDKIEHEKNDDNMVSEDDPENPDREDEAELDSDADDEIAVTKDSFTYRLGIEIALPPLSSNLEIFQDMTAKAVDLGIEQAVKHLNSYKLRIATMCSGTESPILALNRLSEFLPNHGLHFEIDHIFSAEIVPFKQAYIQNNFPGSVIFRDVVEVGDKSRQTATTAYGAQAPIPGDIDILIAGSSCVDFSNLNKVKKELDGGGESGDTFMGIRNYADKHAPKIVILENVVGKAKNWTDLTEQMTSIDYTCTHVFLDSKEYYMPQTRKRGYMICISNILGPSKSTLAVAEAWKQYMSDFKRKASSSVEAFLFDDDDSRIINTRAAEAFEAARSRKDPDWIRGEVGHRNYRNNLGLGHKRPLTKWEDGGFARGPDFYDRTWLGSQGERVYDMLEIQYLRSILRGFDVNQKFRFIDVSQNPFSREEDIKGAGITGCITPKGIPFSTTRGGNILGIECIALQGLPIDKLSFSRESQAQLQDLAGNAMTTTVVAAAIYSTLLASYKFLPSSRESVKLDHTASDRIPSCEDEGLRRVATSLKEGKVSMEDIAALATRTVRLCHCEDQASITINTLWKCQDCGHTACASCVTDKSHHNYKHFTPKRIAPSSFVTLMRNSLPSRLRISTANVDVLKRSHMSHSSEQIWAMCEETIEKALASELRFQSVKRSSIWTVSYASDSAHLDLVISSSCFEWQFFAKPHKSIAGNDPIRAHLTSPVLRMKPSTLDVMSGEWQAWVFQERSIMANVEGSGKFKPSFQNTVGLQAYADTVVHEQYQITASVEERKYLDLDIFGSYRSLNCQHVVAFGSLHIKEQCHAMEPPIGFFMHHDRLGDPKHDSFIFSTDMRRLNYQDVRRQIASMPTDWRPAIYKRIPHPDQLNTYTYEPFTGEAPLKDIPIKLAGHWQALPDTRFTVATGHGCEIYIPGSKPEIGRGRDSCSTPLVVMRCQTSVDQGQDSFWAKDRWMEVDELNQKDFFTEFAWLMQKTHELLGYDIWTDVCCDDYNHCQHCAPTAPRMKWTLMASYNKDKTKTTPSKGVPKLMPFEDPAEAAPFEAAIKSRPKPFIVHFRWATSGRVHLRMSFNPEALMHRAVALLLEEPPNNTTSLRTSWRLITDSFVATIPYQTPFILRSNISDSAADQPPGFHAIARLRPEQLRSLTWMLRQENEPCHFTEEETEEAEIAQIGWRAEGRAQKNVVVRGGILADAVGYGKTIMTLALVSHQRQRDAETAKMPIAGRLAIKATLILVPKALPRQWYAEAKKFLRSDYSIKIIMNLKELAKLTIADFESADIIIAPWNIFDQEAYMFTVAQFSGKVELPLKSGRRVTKAWYHEALKEIESNVELLKGDPSSLSKTIQATYERSKQDATNVETIIPSKRLRGQAYQDAKAKKITVPQGGNAAGSKKQVEPHVLQTRNIDAVFNLKRLGPEKAPYNKLTFPLLELFEFARVVVDEYTYTSGTEGTVIPNLRSRSRWVLSATPSLDTFADIKFMSRFMKINLGVDDLTRGVNKQSTIKAIEEERTDSEIFRSYKKPPSDAWHSHRWQHAQKFLDQFVRQNEAELDTIPGSEHMISVKLPPVERAAYTELFKSLAVTGFVLKPKSRAWIDKERMAREAKMLGDAQTADEALMRCAAHFSLQPPENGSEDLSERPSMRIMQLRREQCQQLETEIAFKLKNAEWLERNNDRPCVHYKHWRSHVRQNVFKDTIVRDDLLDMINTAAARYKKTHRRLFYRTRSEMTADDDDAKEAKKAAVGDKKRKTAMQSKGQLPPLLYAVGKERDGQARVVAASLSQLTNDLVRQRRGLRFFTAVAKFEGIEASPNSMDVDEQPSDCDKCGAIVNIGSQVFVLSSCGHIFCAECRRNLQEKCAAPSCGATFKDYEVVCTSDLCGEKDSNDKISKHYGKKIEDVITLIKSLPASEQVLLFIQFAGFMKTVMTALKENGISVVSLSDGNQPARVLQQFQTNKLDTKTQVLMMNIGDSSAAGSNLTNANHVIFVSPYLSDHVENTHYEAAMTQAKGRARRYGQSKPVHIYQFISLNTIDVDTLQKRTGLLLKDNKEPPKPSFNPYEGFVPSPHVLEKAASAGEKSGYEQPAVGEIFEGDEILW